MNERERICVQDVMKTSFDMVDGMDLVQDAIRTMKHVETKCVIVRKRYPEDEVGMLLISDIARKVLASNKSPERVNVYEIMTKPVITVRPDMDIKHCARLFSRFRLSRAPVVRHGEVVGIVSLTDLVLQGFLRQVQ